MYLAHTYTPKSTSTLQIRNPKPKEDKELKVSHWVRGRTHGPVLVPQLIFLIHINDLLVRI